MSPSVWYVILAYMLPCASKHMASRTQLRSSIQTQLKLLAPDSSRLSAAQTGFTAQPCIHAERQLIASSFTVGDIKCTPYIQRPSREEILHASVVRRERARGNSSNLVLLSKAFSFPPSTLLVLALKKASGSAPLHSLLLRIEQFVLPTLDPRQKS